MIHSFGNGDHMHVPALVPSALVGRERELGILREHLSAALGGQGSLVLIGGEAGIGKTALAEALCQDAKERGALVLVGRCYDLTETPAYGPWIDLFLRIPPAPDLPPLPPVFAARGTVGVVASQMALFVQVHDFLAAVAARHPLVLLLDDVHWADPASLDLLRFLARSLGTVGLLIAVAYRADELTRRHPLTAVLPALVREARAIRLDLRPLDHAAIVTLVCRRYPLMDRDAERLGGYLAARTEGNPFFIEEVLRTLEEGAALTATPDGVRLGDLAGTGVPPLLRQVIERRLGRLDADTQRLLAVAAVIGQTVPLGLWATIAAVAEDAVLVAIEQGLDAHMLAESSDGSGVRFVHALIRETLYVGMAAVRRRPIHRHLGELLAALPHPDPDAVASHFGRAGDERAIAWLVRAGEQAQLAYAWVTASERYEAALAVLESSDNDPGSRGWLRYRIARLRRPTAPLRAIEHLDEAIRLALGGGDRALAAAARYTRGLCLFFAGDYDAAIREMAAGCDALEALSSVEQARLDLGPDERGLPVASNPRGMLVVVLAEVGRIAEAIAMGEAMREGRPRHTPLGELGWGHHGNRDVGLGVAYALAGRPDAAHQAFERAREIFRALANEDYLSSSTTLELLLVSLPYRTERLDEQGWLAAEVAGASQRASATSESRVHVARLPILALHGRWSEAGEEADVAMREGMRGSRGWQALVSPTLGELARRRGDPAAAWSYVRALLLHGPQTAPGTLLLSGGLALIRLAAALSLDAGALPQAHEWLLAHDRWLTWSGAVLGQSEGQTLWASYYRAMGDAERASAHAARALAHATEPRQPLALLAVHRLLGELDTAAGRYGDAAGHLDASLTIATTCAAPHERALTQLARAELLIATDRRGAAATALDDVRAICEPLGATPALARAEALAARIPHPDGLTRREVQVLRLIAAGMSNQEMADTLSISARTIERHIENAYRKIDAHSKADATAYALRHHLA